MTRPGVNDWSSEWEISQFPKICKKKSYSFSLSRLKWNCVNLTQTFDFLRNYLNHWRLTLLILLCAITSLDEIRAYLKFVYSEKATKFCEIFTLLLSTVHTDKSKVEILQNFVTFSEYLNFTKILIQHLKVPMLSNSKKVHMY